MREVLRREDLHVYDKAKLYQQILQRYLNHLALYRNKPLGLLDVNPPTSISPQPQSKLTYGIESLVLGTRGERLSPTQQLPASDLIPSTDTIKPATSPTTSVYQELNRDKTQQFPPNKKGNNIDRGDSEYFFRSRKRSKAKFSCENWGKTS